MEKLQRAFVAININIETSVLSISSQSLNKYTNQQSVMFVEKIIEFGQRIYMNMSYRSLEISHIKFFCTFTCIKEKLPYLMPGSAYNGREDSPGSIITGESGFAHTGSIVYNKGSNFVVTHGGLSAKE